MLFFLALLAIVAVWAIAMPDVRSPAAELQDELMTKVGWGPLGI